MEILLEKFLFIKPELTQEIVPKKRLENIMKEPGETLRELFAGSSVGILARMLKEKNAERSLAVILQKP